MANLSSDPRQTLLSTIYCLNNFHEGFGRLELRLAAAVPVHRIDCEAFTYRCVSETGYTMLKWLVGYRAHHL